MAQFGAIETDEWADAIYLSMCDHLACPTARTLRPDLLMAAQSLPCPKTPDSPQTDVEKNAEGFYEDRCFSRGMTDDLKRTPDYWTAKPANFAGFQREGSTGSRRANRHGWCSVLCQRARRAFSRCLLRRAMSLLNLRRVGSRSGGSASSVGDIGAEIVYEGVEH